MKTIFIYLTLHLFVFLSFGQGQMNLREFGVKGDGKTMETKAIQAALVLKTTKDARSCERVTVTNCVLETNCIGLKLGTESHHDFRHINFSNCVIKSCSRIFGMVCLDGGIMEYININNITGETQLGLDFEPVYSYQP